MTYRIQVAIEIVSESGKVTRAATMPLSSQCLRCGAMVIDSEGIAATLAHRGGTLGLFCKPCGSRRRKAWWQW